MVCGCASGHSSSTAPVTTAAAATPDEIAAAVLRQAIFELRRTDANLVYRFVGADFDTRETIGHQHGESDVGEAPRNVTAKVALSLCTP